MAAADFVFRLAGQTLHLLPERCLFWQEAGLLLLADLHLGKAAHFRHHGLPVPEGHTADDLDRLTSVIHRIRPREVMLCGDLFHAPAAQAPAILSLVQAWRAAHTAIPITLITGNHDRGRAMPPASCGITAAGAALHQAPFQFVHDPAEADGITPAICGHLHPVCALPGSGKSLRAPCFWYQTARQCLVLPAFGSFTAGVAIRPDPADQLHVILPQKVISVPAQFCHPRPLPLPGSRISNLK